MKALIRSALAELAATAGVLRYAERSLRSTLTVLCYHRVLPEEQRKAYHDPDLVVTPEVFRAHCRLLAERYTVERLDVALSKWQSGDRPARPLAAITFDDGAAAARVINAVYRAAAERRHVDLAEFPERGA